MIILTLPMSGQKDAQQCVVVKRLVQQLNFVDIHIEVMPTQMEADGLAMSSRNVYLDDDQRKAAPVLYRALKKAEAYLVNGLSHGRLDAEQMKSLVQAEIASESAVKSIDYISVADADTGLELRLIDGIDSQSGRICVSAALRMDHAIPERQVRLIDNVVVDLCGSRTIRHS